MKKFSLAVAALLFSSSAQAVTYDAFTSFNGRQAAGNFVWLSGAPGGVTLLSSVPCVIDNTICLGLPSGPYGLPGVFKSTGIPSTSHPYQPLDRLLVHPGSDSVLIVFFFALTTAQYSFTATLDALTSGTAVETWAFTSSGGSNSSIGNGFLGALGQSSTFSGTYSLSAGQIIGIGVNNAGNYSSDSTGLQFTVTQLEVAPVPEPATWALMISGFGLVGIAMRRRARTQVGYA